MYMDLFGRWFNVQPELSAAKTPKSIPAIEYDVVNFTEPEQITTTKWGVYTRSMLRKMGEYLEFPSLQNAIVTKLAGQAENIDPDGYITPNSLFPSYALPNGSWAGFLFGRLWSWLLSMGQYTGTVLFIYYSIKWGHSLFTCLYSLQHFYKRYGCTWQLIYSLCPGSHHSREVKREHKSDANTYKEKAPPYVAVESKSGYELPRDYHVLFNTNVLEGLDANYVPNGPTQQEIDQGTLKMMWDTMHNCTPTVRDKALANMPTAPAVYDEDGIRLL